MCCVFGVGFKVDVDHTDKNLGEFSGEIKCTCSFSDSEVLKPSLVYVEAPSPWDFPVTSLSLYVEESQSRQGAGRSRAHCLRARFQSTPAHRYSCTDGDGTCRPGAHLFYFGGTAPGPLLGAGGGLVFVAAASNGLSCPASVCVCVLGTPLVSED